MPILFLNRHTFDHLQLERYVSAVKLYSVIGEYLNRFHRDKTVKLLGTWRYNAM